MPPINWSLCCSNPAILQSRFCITSTTQELALVASEEAQPQEPDPPQWVDEPENLDQLLDTYIIENKVAGRVAGTSLYLSLAKRRDGSEKHVTDGQKFKLWLVALTDFKTCFVVEHPKHCLRISCNASQKNQSLTKTSGSMACKELPKVCHQDDVELLNKEYQLAHGKSSFMKPDSWAVWIPRG